jgi:chemotaxis protein methyltransferase CheR
VILYFGLDVRRWVYQRLYEALNPEGWLVVGHADPPPPNFMPFAVRPFPGVTFFQRSSVLAATRPHLAVTTAARPADRPAGPPNGEPESGGRPLSDSELLPCLYDPLEPEFDLDALQARSGNAEAEAHYRLGRWHADRQHWPEALHHCQKAARLAPSHVFAHYTLALIYQSIGDSEAAIDALRRTIYLMRTWPLPRFTAASIHRSVGQFEAARRELRNVIALTGKLPQDTPIEGGDGLTAARLRAAAERQLNDMKDSF